MKVENNTMKPLHSPALAALYAPPYTKAVLSQFDRPSAALYEYIMGPVHTLARLFPPPPKSPAVTAALENLKKVGL